LRLASCARAWWFSIRPASTLRWPSFSQQSEHRSLSSAAHPPEGQPAFYRRRHPAAPSATKLDALTVRDLIGMGFINPFTRLPSQRGAGM
jgi:hypothetical protein